MANYSAEAGALTPDALLEYCQTQLAGIDGNINQLMTQQNASAKSSSALSDVANELQGHADGFQTQGQTPSGNAGADTLDTADSQKINSDFVTTLQTALANTTDPSTQASIKALLSKWQATYNDDGNVSQTEVGQMLDGIKDIQSDMSTVQQTAMIQIQSLVSQRGQSIQMTSSIIQSFNDSTKGVIANINQ
jgi:hypothetical protein